MLDPTAKRIADLIAKEKITPRQGYQMLKEMYILDVPSEAREKPRKSYQK